MTLPLTSTLTYRCGAGWFHCQLQLMSSGCHTCEKLGFSPLSLIVFDSRGHEALCMFHFASAVGGLQRVHGSVSPVFALSVFLHK